MLTIKTHIAKIGNSRGVRLPRVLLEQVALGPDVEVTALSDHLIIRPLRLRAGWAERFKQIAKQKPAKSSLGFPASNQWDKAEREW
jgi:antitoxin MazE